MPRLVKLFNHANQEVQRHATGAMRNLIYDNADNKLALVEENGIFELLRTLREQDDELRKNVTGASPACPLPSPFLRSAFLSLSLFSVSVFVPPCAVSFLDPHHDSWGRPPVPGAHIPRLHCSPMTLRVTLRLSPAGFWVRLTVSGGALGEVRYLLPPSPEEPEGVGGLS